MTTKQLFLTAGAGAIVCVGSAIVASSSSIVGDGFDGLGLAINITVFVTLPAFLVGLGFGVAGCFRAYRARRLK